MLFRWVLKTKKLSSLKQFFFNEKFLIQTQPFLALQRRAKKNKTKEIRNCERNLVRQIIKFMTTVVMIKHRSFKCYAGMGHQSRKKLRQISFVSPQLRLLVEKFIGKLKRTNDKIQYVWINRLDVLNVSINDEKNVKIHEWC